jgi:peptidyl-prolyl cis-trans isomerase A (cyclophilin A)
MRRILWAVPALLALIGCSPSSETKKEEPKKEAVAPKKEEPVPDVYKLNLDTSKGLVVVEVHHAWAPNGADHLYRLAKDGFYDGSRFYRYVRGFIVQFGINGDPKINNRWRDVNLPDDPFKQTNAKGTLTYATAGPRTRSTQLFFNLRNNKELDSKGFTPVGKVVSGMDVVEGLYRMYGEIPQQGGQGPNPDMIESQGNEYLMSHFPLLDYIKKATVQ